MPSSMKTPSRRMTLGGVSSNRSNRRVSMAPSPNNKRSQRPPRASRKSMLPRIDGRENAMPSTSPVSTSSSRRKSMGNGRQSMLPPPPNTSSGTTSKPDTRPINDKGFQQQCIRDLYTFLLESGYDNPVTIKTLTRPSGKDFNHICTFLLRLIDPNFQRGNLKFEDEVSLCFRSVGYPFNVSKTALVAAGSAHTWPTLLAALAWLMDHIKVHRAHKEQLAKEDEKPFQSLQELELKSNKAFFDYMLKAYEAFMMGDAHLTEQLEIQLADRFERDDAYLAQEVQRVTDLNAVIVERIESVAAESQDLTSYTKKREEYATDLEQFHDLIRQMNEHKTALEQKVKKHSADLDQTNSELDKMSGFIEQLKKEIQSQDLSVDDVRALESELKGLNESWDRASALCDQRKEALATAKEDLDAVCNRLETSINKYNTSLSELQMLPGHTSSLGKIHANLNRDSLLSENVRAITGVDFTDEVLSVVDGAGEQLWTEINNTKSTYQDVLDKVQKSIDECQSAESQLEILKEKTAKVEKSIEDEEETHRAKTAVRQREIEALESKVAARRDPVALEEQISAYQRQCAELEALQLQHQEESKIEVQALQDEIDRSTKLMMEHEAHWKETIQNVRTYWNEKQAAALKVTVPAGLREKADPSADYV